VSAVCVASLYGVQWGYVMLNFISAMSLAVSMKVFRLYVFNTMTRVRVLFTSRVHGVWACALVV
jgi:hypothetical protein